MNPLSVEQSTEYRVQSTEFEILKYEHVKKYTIKGVKN